MDMSRLSKVFQQHTSQSQKQTMFGVSVLQPGSSPKRIPRLEVTTYFIERRLVLPHDFEFILKYNLRPENILRNLNLELTNNIDVLKSFDSLEKQNNVDNSGDVPVQWFTSDTT